MHRYLGIKKDELLFIVHVLIYIQDKIKRVTKIIKIILRPCTNNEACDEYRVINIFNKIPLINVKAKCTKAKCKNIREIF